MSELVQVKKPNIRKWVQLFKWTAKNLDRHKPVIDVPEGVPTPETHGYTFEQICPRWNSVNLGLSKEDGQDIVFTNMSRCVVGEAWGFSDDYRGKCRTCSAYSNGGIVDGRTINGFNHHIRNYPWTTKEERQQNEQYIKSFAKHMNEAHSHILIRRFGA